MNVNKGEDGKSIFKKIVTYENKTSIGIIGVVFGLFIGLLLMLRNPTWWTESLEICIAIVLPSAILLCTTETIKNNKVIGSISLILNVLVTFLLLSMFNSCIHQGYTLLVVLVSIYVAYGYMCSLSYFVKNPKCDEVAVNNNEVINIEGNNFCKHCGSKIEPDSKFCSNCGREI